MSKRIAIGLVAVTCLLALVPQALAGRNDVFYLADSAGDGVEELFQIRGRKGEVRRISAPQVPGGEVREYAVDRRGRFVVYRADQIVDGIDELFHVDLKSGEVTRISGELVDDGEVAQFQIGPRGRYVVFRADKDEDDVFELYRVDLRKDFELIKVNGELVTNGSVDMEFCFGPRGRRLAYVADEDELFVDELFLADLRKGTAVKVNGTLTSLGGQVLSAAFTPRGRRLVYRRRAGPDEPIELVAFDTKKEQRTILSGELDDDRVVSSFRIGPRGRGAVFVADEDLQGQFEAYYVRFKNAERTKLNGILAGGDVSTGPSAMDRRERTAFYTAAEDDPAHRELHAVDLRSFERRRISGDLVDGGDVGTYVVAPRGRKLVYKADQETDEVDELFLVRLGRDEPPEKISGDVIPDGDVGVLAMGPRGRGLVFRGDLEVNDVTDFYHVSLGKQPQRTKLNDPIRGTDDVGSDFFFDRRGKSVIYTAADEVPGKRELHRVRLRKSFESETINAPIDDGGDVGSPAAPGS